jgi:hypothetical protein
MNALDIRTIVRDQVTDVSENFWSDNEIYRYMSMGAREMLLQYPELASDVTSIPVTIGQGYYTVPTSVQVNWMGWVDSAHSVADATNIEVFKKLKKIDLTDQYSAMGDTTSSGADPEYYNQTTPTNINVYPSPSQTGSLVMEYVTHYADITSTTTFNNRIEPYAQYLVDYCTYRMFLKDQEMVTEAQTAKNLWKEGLENIGEYLAASKRSDRYFQVKNEDCYMSNQLGMI